jgi:arylsulfatase A-like enzyme
MRHLYQRAISYMDAWLAQVLEALDRRGILDQTLVIVTSDHGENFGEGELIAHGFSLDQRLLHVPLVLAGPGTPVHDRLFSLAELPRLIAGAAEIDPNPWPHDELPHRVAIGQYDPIGTPDNPKIEEFAARWMLDERGVDRLTAGFTCATDGRLKLVRRNSVEALFDLDADPGERAPIATTNGQAAELRAALAHPAALAVPTAGTAEAGSVAGPQASADELEALERQMKLLGYL